LKQKQNSEELKKNIDLHFLSYLEKINSENIENKLKTLFRINLQISNFKKENSEFFYLVFLPDL